MHDRPARARDGGLGLAGALAYGFYGVIQAFRVPGASPGARGKALTDLALGVFVGPLRARSVIWCGRHRGHRPVLALSLLRRVSW